MRALIIKLRDEFNAEEDVDPHVIIDQWHTNVTVAQRDNIACVFRYVSSFATYPALIAAMPAPFALPDEFTNMYGASNPAPATIAATFPSQKMLRQFEHIVAYDSFFAGLPQGVALFRMYAGQPAVVTPVGRFVP